MPRPRNDPSQAENPVSFPFGATSSEAANELQVAKNPLQGPATTAGGRLGYQFELPRYDNPEASPSATISRDTHGGSNG